MNLRKGDKVVVIAGDRSRSGVVASVTTDTIILVDGSRFDTSGKRLGARGFWGERIDAQATRVAAFSRWFAT